MFDSFKPHGPRFELFERLERLEGWSLYLHQRVHRDDSVSLLQND
jgi:hypothetical protein